MSDDLQDFEEYIGEWVASADELIDEKEAELAALIEKRNEAASTIGRDARDDESEDDGDGEENGPRQGSLEEDEDEDR